MHGHRHLSEIGAWVSLGFAAISLSQAAFVLTIVATALSIVLAFIKIHDRFKYGPTGYRSGE
jgi:hypothetical protein